MIEWGLRPPFFSLKEVMNSFTKNGNWVDMIKVNIPDHASDLEQHLTRVMASTDLTVEEAHGCALAAAAASGNGELAFEISMNSPLFGSNVREAIIQVVLHQAVNSTYSAFTDCVELFNMTIASDSNEFVGEAHRTYSGLSPDQYGLYSLAAATVNKSEQELSRVIQMLRLLGVPTEKMVAAARIAAVVSALTKVVL